MQPIQDIIESFELFDEWQDRYRHLIELGRDLPILDEALKIDANLVEGCQSRVWLVANSAPDRDALEFRADSDAAIVKGLIYLILALYSGNDAQTIVHTDVDAVFGQLGLAQHLSMSRRNGFYAMVQRIKLLAVHHAARNPSPDVGAGTASEAGPNSTSNTTLNSTPSSTE